MKKIIIIITLVGVMATFTGCGEEKEIKENNTGIEEIKVEEILVEEIQVEEITFENSTTYWD
jgi:hypothetical protein